MERLSLPEADRPCGVSVLHQTSIRDTYPLHTHDFYEIFYVMRGQAMHAINGQNECCMTGTLVLIRPADRHMYTFINQWDMELISIGIDRRIMAEVLAFTGIDEENLTRTSLPSRVQLDAPEASALARELLRLEGVTAPDRRRQLGKTLLARLLVALTETEPASISLPAWLNTLLTEMSEPENFRAGLRRMVELSRVTQSHLNREMKRCLGLTPTAFINAKRIALAGDLLLTGQYTSLEVAGLCGFETPSHFHENFRRIYGCAPRDFTARHSRKEQV